MSSAGGAGAVLSPLVDAGSIKLGMTVQYTRPGLPSRATLARWRNGLTKNKCTVLHRGKEETLASI